MDRSLIAIAIRPYLYNVKYNSHGLSRIICVSRRCRVSRSVVPLENLRILHRLLVSLRFVNTIQFQIRQTSITQASCADSKFSTESLDTSHSLPFTLQRTSWWEVNSPSSQTTEERRPKMVKPTPGQTELKSIAAYKGEWNLLDFSFILHTETSFPIVFSFLFSLHVSRLFRPTLCEVWLNLTLTMFDFSRSPQAKERPREKSIVRQSSNPFPMNHRNRMLVVV